MRWKEKPTKEAFLGTRIRCDAKKKESDNFSGSYLSVHFITSAMYGRGSGGVGRSSALGRARRDRYVRVHRHATLQPP